MATISLRREFPFIPKQRYFIALSILVVIASLAAIWTIGLNRGIDFTGGIKLTVRLPAETTDGAVTEALTAGGVDASVQRLGEAKDRRFMIKLRPLAVLAAPGSESETPTPGAPEALIRAPVALIRQAEGDAQPVIASTTKALDAKYGNGVTQIEGQEAVGPRVGKELLRKGQGAILFTLIALLIYIGFRFDFYFAPGAIIALFHDVIITMGFLVVSHREYDLTTLAALLTIVGYSINDTIIIYDRIREHGREITPDNIEAVVNKALNDTLSRTIVTSLTVLFVVVILFFTTQGVIQNFAYAFIIGVIAGSYSSIFIASPIYIWLYRHFPQWRKT